MSLRRLYAPLRPDLDDFLFAAVGEEINGAPLSMISVLTRLGLDPWDEAGRLASLGKQEAIDRLAQIIARLPDAPWPALEATRIAGGLIELLPKRGETRSSRTADPPRRLARPPAQAKLWLIGLILGAAVVVTVIAQGGLPFSGREPAQAPRTIEAPHNTK